ncbi:MAG: hypothetical protein WBP33_13510 [Saprospiraceae bacterium]|nr:hypothetical protein [Candidatus Vicinibacter proximus]MCC6842433.1 hypothetical protein [Saprospiraceae bacterium]
MKNLLILAGLLLFISSCKTDSNSKSASNKPGNNRAAEFQPISPAVLTELNKSCTSIDIISLKKEVNASMSFSNPSAIQYVVSFIGDDKGILTACNPDGHLMFQKNGEITHEADIYFNGGCNAVVWTKGGKIEFVNNISPEGVEFFKNFLKPRAEPLSDSLVKANIK